jgi:hypothetical protein
MAQVDSQMYPADAVRRRLLAPGKHAAPVHLQTVYTWYSRHLDDLSSCSLKSYSEAQSSTVLALHAYTYSHTHLCPVPITFPLRSQDKAPRKILPAWTILCTLPQATPQTTIVTTKIWYLPHIDSAIVKPLNWSSELSSGTRSGVLYCLLAALSFIMI